jgi:hypothetical protein
MPRRRPRSRRGHLILLRLPASPKPHLNSETLNPQQSIMGHAVNSTPGERTCRRPPMPIVDPSGPCDARCGAQAPAAEHHRATPKKAMQ